MSETEPELPFGIDLDSVEQPEEEPGYFVLEGAAALGPFTVAEIYRRLNESSLTGESYAWTQTMEEWKTLREIFYPASPVSDSEPFYTYDMFASAPEISKTAPPIVLAPFLKRFLAGAIDLGLIVLAYILLVLFIPPLRHWMEDIGSNTAGYGYLITNLVLSSLVSLAYILFLGPPGKGMTPGYRLLKLRLADQDTLATPDWRHVFLWSLGSLTLPVGWVFYWFDSERRMLHNRISRTIVVSARP